MALYPERVLKEILKHRVVRMPKTVHKIIIGDGRFMGEIENNEIHLVITSPPYPMVRIWDDYYESLAVKKFEEMHEYLAQVWAECYRVLVDGGMACILIGDITKKVDGIVRLFSNHTKIIEKCEELGFVTLPCILWKRPTYELNAFQDSARTLIPTNAYVTLDYDYILLFRKGSPRMFKPKDPYRYASYFTKMERDFWFSPIWDIAGEKQVSNEIERRIAAFPEEIVYRLLRMFSIIGDTVLDPFLGTGTTTRVAMNLYRNSIGYEIDEGLLKLIKKQTSYHKKLRGPRNICVQIISRDDRRKYLDLTEIEKITKRAKKKKVQYFEIERIWKEARKTNDQNRKGKLLEELFIQLIQIDRNLILCDHNVKTKSEEIDIVILPRAISPFWSRISSPLILLECKNWKNKIGSKDVRDFAGKIENRPKLLCRIGFLIAISGFTADAEEELVGYRARDFILATITGNQIDDLMKSKMKISDLLQERLINAGFR